MTALEVSQDGARLIVQLRLGHATIDLNSGHGVSADGTSFALSTRERAVLNYLVEGSGTDVARTARGRFQLAIGSSTWTAAWTVPSTAFSNFLPAGATVSGVERTAGAILKGPNHGYDLEDAEGHPNPLLFGRRSRSSSTVRPRMGSSAAWPTHGFHGGGGLAS